MTDAEKLSICERRCRFWWASAMLAACGKISLQQLLLCSVLYGWNGPSDEDVNKAVNEAKAAVIERGASEDEACSHP